jgi:hypothetical protein
MDKSIAALLVLVLIVSTVSLIVQPAKAALSYGGDYHGTGASSPSVVFSITDDAVLYNVGNSSIGFFTNMPYPADLMTLGVSLTQVSYKASWLNNTVTVYQGNTGELLSASLGTNTKTSLFCAIDLTNAPLGPQQIEVNVKGEGVISDFSKYYPFYKTTSAKVSFTINPAPPETVNTSSWNTKTVDTQSSGASKRYPIAVDSKGNPHIAYDRSAGGANFINYASWNQTAWSFQTVDQGYLLDLTLDANDTPHLLYGWGGFTYASWTGSNWSKQNVDPDSGNCFGTIALDAQGNPNVAYDNGTTVKFAQRTVSGWNIQTIDSPDAPAAPFQISIAVAKNNTRYILYCYHSESADKNIVKIATNDGSGWNIQTVSSISTVSGIGNIVLDSKSQPHFVLSQNTNSTAYPTLKNIQYYSWAGENWTTNEAASNFSLNSEFSDCPINAGSVRLDSNDFAHITYIKSVYDSNSSKNFLMYTVWNGSSWKTETINIETEPSKPAFLALDSSGSPHISYIGPIPRGYYIHSSASLIYATINEPTVTLTPTSTAFTQDSSAWAPIAISIIFVGLITAILILYWLHGKSNNDTTDSK